MFTHSVSIYFQTSSTIFRLLKKLLASESVATTERGIAVDYTDQRIQFWLDTVAFPVGFKHENSVRC